MQLNVLACNCKGQILAYFLLFLCFYDYSSYFISIFQVSTLFQYKYFPLSDEKHYSVSSKKDMNKFLLLFIGIRRRLRGTGYVTTYITFLENSTENDIIYWHCSCLLPLLLYHSF